MEVSGNAEFIRNTEFIGNIDGDIQHENEIRSAVTEDNMPSTMAFTDDRDKSNETDGRRNRWNFSIATNVITSGNRQKNSNSRGKRHVSSTSSTLMDSKLQIVEVDTEETFVFTREDEVREESEQKLTQATPL